jgi:hypothetical protein
MDDTACVLENYFTVMIERFDIKACRTGYEKGDNMRLQYYHRHLIWKPHGSWKKVADDIASGWAQKSPIGWVWFVGYAFREITWLRCCKGVYCQGLRMDIVSADVEARLTRGRGVCYVHLRTGKRNRRIWSSND